MKTKTKLLILIAIVLLSVGGGGGFFVWRKAQMNKRVMGYKPQAYADIENRAYGKALGILGAYLNHHPDDMEALYTYAKLRLRQPLPKAAHIRQAIQPLRKVIDAQPDHPEARYILFDLYLNTGMLVEADQMAGEILRLEPENAEILVSRAQALIGLKRFADNPSTGALGAESMLERALAIEPHRLDYHVTLMQLRIANNAARRVNLRYARDLKQQYPDDPRYTLLEAVALSLEGQKEQAHQLADQVKNKLIDDEHYLVLLTRLFEQRKDTDIDFTSKRFSASMYLIDQARQQFPDSEAVKRLYAERLWEWGQGAALLDFLKEAPNDSPQTPTWMLRLKALALSASGRKDQVALIADQLEVRENDPFAIAWASVLNEGFVEGAKADPQTLADICQSGLIQEPRAPYLQFVLGSVQAQLGNTEQAKKAWGAAVQLAPSWSQPFARLAQLANTKTEYRQAATFAGLALERSPSSIEAWIAMVVAASQEEGILEAEELIEKCAMIQERFPQEPKTLPIYIKLLVENNQEVQARQILEAAAGADPPLAQSLLYQLVIVSQQKGLGLEAELIEASNKASGSNPAMAFLQARQLYDTQGADAARKLFDELSESVTQTPESAPTWRIIRAELLTLIADPSANAAWIELGDEHADDIGIQKLILSKTPLQSEYDFIDRTIERYRKIGGANDALWRMARARWIMSRAGNLEAASREAARKIQQVDGSDTASLVKDNADRAVQIEEAYAEAAMLINEAIKLEPGKVEPHYRLAICLAKLNSSEGSIEHFQKAIELEPESNEIALALAAQLTARGDHKAARQYLDRVTHHEQITARQSLSAALMLLNTGDTAAALEMAKDIVLDGTPAQAIYLADIYERAGDIDGATERVEALLASEQGRDDSSALQYAAHFYAKAGERDKADAALGRYQELDLPQRQKDLATASYLQRFGAPDLAIEKFEQALKQAPGNINLWMQLAAFQAQQGDLEAAFDVIAQGATLNPDQPDFAAINRHRDLALGYRQMPILAPVVLTLLTDARHRDIAIKVLKLTKEVDDSEGAISSAIMLDRLKRIVNQNPDYVQGQYLLAQSHLVSGQFDEARVIAVRLMGQHPAEFMPAYLATQAAVGAKEWTLVDRYAGAWKQRAPSQVVAADQILAKVSLYRSDPAKAVALLSPHLDEALGSAQARQSFFALLAQALCQAGQVAEAEQLLGQLYELDDAWVVLWLQTAVNYLEREEDAVRWLDEIDKLLVDTQFTERLELATSFRSLSQRFNDRSLFDRGHAIVERLATHSQAPAAVHFTLGATVESQAQLTDAETHYRKALAADADYLLAKNNLAMVLATQKKDLAEAASLALQVVEATPKSPNAYDTYAIALFAGGQYSQAIEQMLKVLDLTPDPSPAVASRVNLFVAESYVQLKDPEKAQAHLAPYIESLSQDPTDNQLQTVAGLVGTLIKKGYVQEGRAVMLDRLADSPEVREMWRMAAIHSLEDQSVAVAWLEELQRATSSVEPDQQLRLVRAWQQVGVKFDDAVLLERAQRELQRVAESPGVTSETLLIVASIAEVNGDLDHAIKWYRQVLVLEPTNLAALNNLAVVLADAEGDASQKAEALTHARQAVRLAKGNAIIFDTLAYVQFKNGQIDEALASLQKSIDTEATSAKWKVNYLWILARSQRSAELGARSKLYMPQIESVELWDPKMQGKVDLVVEALGELKR